MKKMTNDRAVFDSQYKLLNDQQKEAVDTIEGPVMVVAGPGTGKTQILTLRIGKILLETDTQPDSILALTFTEAGAKAMRERLHRYIGAAAYQVSINTFHGFAERLIRDYPDAYDRVVGGRAASDLDKIDIIETILSEPSFKLLRPIGNPSYYVKPIISILGSLKKEYITPNKLAELIDLQEDTLQGIEQYHAKGAHKGKQRGEYTKLEKDIAKNRELLVLYRQYELLLSEKRLYDFEDMIVETVRALESNEDMLRDLQENYQYILADEHQDVNGAQNRILELLANFHDQPNIFVVGDEKQAIYRFQGASLENFLYFETLFQNAKRISLTENYRSGQTILDSAHSLVAVEGGPLASLRVPLEAKAVDSSIIEDRHFSHQAVEDAWVANRVKQLVSDGIDPDEIAIIVRTNREVELYASLLRKEGVQVEASADGDILDHPITHSVQDFIATVTEGHSEQALFKLLHGAYWEISNDDLVRIASARSYDTSLVSIITDAQKLTELGVEGVESVLKVSQVLEEARALSVTMPPHRVLELLLTKSGFLDHVMANDPIEGPRVVRRVYDEIEKLVIYNSKATLSEVSEVLHSYREHRIALNAPYISSNKKSVQVMTAHKSKGLEFSAVFVPHVVDSAWGGTKKRNLFNIQFGEEVAAEDLIDDEKRLLYVAMTRAKTQLFFSSAEQSGEGRELIRSRLFDAIDETTINQCDVDSIESEFNPIGDLAYSDQESSITPALLLKHLSDRGLSATALNNYLASPYNYLYRNVMRIPEVQATPMLFGTAMHGVMERVVKGYVADKKILSATEVKAVLEVQLSRLPISQDEFVRLHEKGLESLLAYISEIKNQINANHKVEFAVSVTLETGLEELPELKLTGKLDRLDFDESGRLLRVVDYKTGKPKTRNHIEGKTKDSTGDYKRQLVFYALMLSLYEDDNYNCREGVLSFIEPDTKGVIHEEVFQITDEEILDLKQELIRVAKEIVSGSFLLTPPTEDCAYWDLAKQLGGE
tara:strand:+ start:8529 stop:11528 length:3000 start_codon:yes stop_codon:yes gene_type:complete